MKKQNTFNGDTATEFISNAMNNHGLGMIQNIHIKIFPKNKKNGLQFDFNKEILNGHSIQEHLNNILQIEKEAIKNKIGVISDIEITYKKSCKRGVSIWKNESIYPKPKPILRLEKVLGVELEAKIIRKKQ